MGLPNKLISQFAKVTNDDKKRTKKESTVYGTIVTQDGSDYLHIDGSYDQDGNPILQPFVATVSASEYDRVIVSIKNHMAVVTGNLTTPSTTVEHVNVVEKTITESIETDYVKTDDLEANYVKTQTLETEYLNATAIETDYAKIKEMDVRYGEFKTLKTDYGVFKTAYADNLKATNADIEDLDADVAHINELMFGSATGEVMQTAFANAVIALLGNAQIKSAMIESLSADKINAGSLNTKNVRIVSNDGSLVIFDNLIQIKDGTDVRIQIGKDAEGNYSILICDQNGATMFDANGITENAIKDAIIRNDMVAEDANISGSKIDIDSLITEINENGSTTIKSTKIVMDDEKQTLSAAFTSLSGDVKAHGTAITALSDKIESKVWQQDIDSLHIGGRNLLKNSRHVPLRSNNEAVYPITSTLETENGREFYRYIRTSPELTPGTMSTYSAIPITQLTEILTGKEVTFSFLIRCSHDTLINTMGMIVDRADSETEDFGSGAAKIPVGTAWKRVSVTEFIDLEYEHSASNVLRFNPLNTSIPDGEIDNFYMDVCEWKIEFGNKATDWTPAPEDVDSEIEALSTRYSLIEQDVDSISTTVAKHTAQISDNESRLSVTQTTVEQLADSISMLVTDGNGTSLMTQTEDGWTFSTAEIQSVVDKTSEGLSALVDQCGNTDAAVEVLQQAVSDLGILGEYIKIGTYEDEPCIELGEGDSNFKLRITNTRIMFMDGSDIPACINNKSLYIKKAVIEEELHQGGYAWVARSNGHLSLVWKGATD